MMNTGNTGWCHKNETTHQL